MSAKSLIAKSSLWSFGGQVFAKLFSFIYTVIIARLLFPEDIGAFYLALSVINITFIFTDLGIDYSLTRYVPYLFGKKELGKLKFLTKLSYFGGGLLTLVCSSAVFFFSDGIASLVNSPAISPPIRILAIYLFVNEIYIVTSGILRGRKMIKETAVITSFQSFAKLLFTILLIYYFGAGPDALAAGFLVSFAVALPLGIRWALKEIKKWQQTEIKLTIKEKISFSREIVHFGLVTSMIIALWAIVQHTDKIMLGYFELPLSEIGIYSIALGLANLALIFPTSINNIFLPLASELFGKGEKKELSRIITTSVKWMVVVMLPIVLLMTIFSDSLLRMFYGEIYAPGWIVFSLFTVGLFIRSVFSICGNTIVAMRRLDVQFKIMVAAAVSNIVLNLLFIPELGINGAALASFISFLISSLMMFYYSRGLFDFRFPKESYRPLAAGLVAFVLLYLTRPYIAGFISQVPVYAIEGFVGGLGASVVSKLVKLAIFGIMFFLTTALYLALLIVSRSFSDDELTLLEKGLRKARIPAKYIKWAVRVFSGRF